MPYRVVKKQLSGLDAAALWELLENADKTHVAGWKDTIAKGREAHGLNLAEAAVLLNTPPTPEVLGELREAALAVKRAIYGNRLVFFAPLYISNQCVNHCLYCAFRAPNAALARRTLTLGEIQKETLRLTAQGHKRLLLVAGEGCAFEYILDALGAMYQVKVAGDEVRRINVNIAPPTVEQLSALRTAGIGTYQCFQETYHPATYHLMHPQGPKSDYAWRLGVMDRALQAGVDDFSTGVLLGLFDYRFDILALLSHAEYLEKTYGVGPHAVSIPRLRPAFGTPLCGEAALGDWPHLVSDEAFQLVVGVLRLALPYAGIILSTRESPAMRSALIAGGVTQLSAGSRTEVGGYQENAASTSGQFEIEDPRPLDEVVRHVLEQGQLPSFCTACYRQGRTGETIMDLIKPGEIKHYCFPNALLTCKEYLLDHASPETRKIGEAWLQKELAHLPEQMRTEVIQRLDKIDAGKRDLFF
jgi:2-iminoacetate synthase